jgi:RNase P subunit RPR2
MVLWVNNELVSAKALEVICEDCGRTRRLDRWKLIELDEGGVKSFHQLGHRLRCKTCRAAQGEGNNVRMRPIWKSRH